MVLSAKIHFLALPTYAFFKHKHKSRYVDSCIFIHRGDPGEERTLQQWRAPQLPRNSSERKIQEQAHSPDRNESVLDFLLHSEGIQQRARFGGRSRVPVG